MHEDLLRHIWSKQLFDTTRLVTLDGRAVRILDPGTLSRISGPDFLDAKIDIGGTMYSGAVEFHRTMDDWRLHRHHTDSHYNQVILHVVMQGIPEPIKTQSGRGLPTLALQPYLRSSFNTLKDHLAREEFTSKKREIKCASVNKDIDADIILQWIPTLYRERLKEKIDRLHEHLVEIILAYQLSISEQHIPYHDERPDDLLPAAAIDRRLYRWKICWEQLLYYHVMDALGYSNNRTPMKKLAEQVSYFQLHQISRDWEIKEGIIAPLTLHHIEAILFKASGLLPFIEEVKDQSTKVYLHSLSVAWDELPKKAAVMPMFRSEWNFSPTRPSNFPTMRIAAASNIIHRMMYGSLFKSLITMFGEKYASTQETMRRLLTLLRFDNHSFWNNHYSFMETAPDSHGILGIARQWDIIVNVFIPFVSLYASIFQQEKLFDRTMAVALEAPLLEDNAILRTMEKQLIRKKITIRSAYQQQGLLHLYKNYCTHERCLECRIGTILFNH